jgi:hypothetical protein
MIHNNPRVEALRTHSTSELKAVRQLEAQIKKGSLDELRLIGHWLKDIETFFISDLSRQSRTPQEEAWWLDQADNMLQICISKLRPLQTKFKEFGPGNIEIAG